MKSQDIQSKFDALFVAIKNRNEVKYSKDNDITLKFMIKNEKSIKSGMLKIDATQFDRYIAMNDANGKNENYIAVKANVKIVRMLSAIGSKLVSVLDDYSASIIANALNNDNILLSKSALASLSRDIEFTEFDQQQVLKARMRSAVTTASTQRSSTREMLRALDLATIHKKANNDSIVLNERGLKLFAELFA